MSELHPEWVYWKANANVAPWKCARIEQEYPTDIHLFSCMLCSIQEHASYPVHPFASCWSTYWYRGPVSITFFGMSCFKGGCLKVKDVVFCFSGNKHGCLPCCRRTIYFVQRGNNKFYKCFPYRVFRKAGLCVRKVLWSTFTVLTVSLWLKKKTNVK